MAALALVGLSHASAPVALRERLAFAGERRLEAQLILHRAGVAELAIVSTCNRSEIYYLPSPGAREAVDLFLVERSGLAAAELEPSLYRHDGEAALAHLFRVASGMESLVLGEPQILGQVKDAFEAALASGQASSGFARIYQQTLLCAKAVRRDTELGRGLTSVASIAVQLARSIFGSLAGRRVLLVGAGEMCELAATHFHEAGVAHIDCANRTESKAQSLAARFGGRGWPLDNLALAARDADILLCSTGSDSAVITPPMIRELMKQRGSPLFLIDIAVPRDVDPEVNRIPEVFVYDMDALQKVAQENRSARERALEQAEEIVRNSLEAVRRDEETASLGPLIASFRQRTNGLKDEELEKLFRRSDFSEEQKKAVERTFDLVLNKLMHDPIITLREGVKRDNPSRVVQAFRDFFNL
ncbi:MAG: glutamyl-tRNA reductase [Verrucomicrobiota bacterium]|jgi:glutamyl-tRNA reductase